MSNFSTAAAAVAVVYQTDAGFPAPRSCVLCSTVWCFGRIQWLPKKPVIDLENGLCSPHETQNWCACVHVRARACVCVVACCLRQDALPMGLGFFQIKLV